MLNVNIQLFGGRGVSGVHRLDIIKKSTGDKSKIIKEGTPPAFKNYIVTYSITDASGTKSRRLIIEARNKQDARNQANKFQKANTKKKKRYRIKNIVEDK